MNRCWRRICSLGPAVSLVIFASRAALAASHDAEASKLRDAAIYQDYLATDFAAAEAKLKQALALCEAPGDCRGATRARLHCDLGAIYFVSKKAAPGRAEFAAAIKQDPSVSLEPDLSTPELQRELAAAKTAASNSSTASESETAGAPTHGRSAGPATGKADASKANTSTAADSDCPPGLPGCKTAAAPTTCASDEDCEGGERCDDHRCVEPTQASAGPGKKNWVSLAFQADVVLLPAKHDVCLGGQGYSCFKSDGSSYTDTPARNYAGQVLGGLQPGTMRVLAGYDRAVLPNVTVGGALGFAFNGGPKRPNGSAFLPLHLEVRGRYWFGRDPLGRAGFRFFGAIEAGLEEAAASIKSVVYAQNATAGTPATTVNAWYHTGRGFGGLGLGAMYAFTPDTGLSLEVRGQELFPTTGTVLSAQLAYAIGF